MCRMKYGIWHSASESQRDAGGDLQIMRGKAQLPNSHEFAPVKELVFILAPFVVRRDLNGSYQFTSN